METALYSYNIDHMNLNIENFDVAGVPSGFGLFRTIAAVHNQWNQRLIVRAWTASWLLFRGKASSFPNKALPAADVHFRPNPEGTQVARDFDVTRQIIMRIRNKSAAKG